MKTTGNDSTVAIDQNSVRNAVHCIKLCAFTLPELQVRHLRPGHIQFFNRLFPCSSILIKRYTDDFEVFAFVLSVSFYQVRHFTTARTTPASPEVYQYHFTFTCVIRQFHSFSFRSLHFEVNELSTYGSLLLFFSLFLNFYDCFVILEISRDLFQQSCILFSRVIVESLFEQEYTYRVGDVFLYTFFDYFIIFFFQPGTFFLLGFFLLVTQRRISHRFVDSVHLLADIIDLSSDSLVSVIVGSTGCRIIVLCQCNVYFTVFKEEINHQRFSVHFASDITVYCRILCAFEGESTFRDDCGI